jgi:hypothetical protein
LSFEATEGEETMKASFRKYWRYLTLFLLSFTFVFSCSEDPVEPPSKPKATCVAASEAIVGWWPLDELGTTAQDLVAGNNGDYGGNPSEAGGKVAGAVRFDGVDDCVEVRDPGVGWAYDFEGSFTLEAWVMRESDQTSQQIIVGKAYAYVLAFREGRPIGYISYVSEAYGVTKVPIGEWHHIATIRMPKR